MEILKIINKFLSMLSWKDFVILGLLVVLLFKLPYTSKEKIKTIPPVLVPVTTVLDKNHKIESVIPVDLFTKEQIKKISDSIKKTLSITKIETVIQTVTHTDSFTKEVTVYIDTHTHTIFAQDSNVYLKQTFKGNSLTSVGTFTLKLTNDTISTVVGSKHKFLGSDLTNVYTVHSNPYFSTIAGSSYTYKQTKNLMSVGPFLGVNTQGVVVLGIGVSFNLIGIWKTK